MDLVSSNIICFFLFAFIIFLKFQTKKLFILLSLFIAHYCNIILVSILEPVIWRYSFYTDLPLSVIVIAIIGSSLFVQH